MTTDTFKNEYVRAAESLKADILKENFSIPSRTADIEESLKVFQQKFAPEVLEQLEDKDLLTSLFYTTGDNTDTLCYWLEREPGFKAEFGSVLGGSVYKFGLCKRKETGSWMTGSKKPRQITEQEALEIGKKIRDALVTGAKIIRNSTLDSVEAYETLNDTLEKEIGSQIYHWNWVHKYFSLICNDKLSGFHSDTWQFHVLRSLGIRPSAKYYARSGQIAMVQKYNNWYYSQFFDAFFEIYGSPIQFVRLGCKDEIKVYASEWAEQGVVGIGWPALGDLTGYKTTGVFDRNAVKNKLVELYYPDDERTASTKSGEIERFYTCNGDNTIFVIMLGQQLLAMAHQIGDYFYDETSAMPHKRKAVWKYVFNPGKDTLPTPSHGGTRTSCYHIKNDEDNMLYLYDKYYNGDEISSANDMPPGKPVTPLTPLTGDIYSVNPSRTQAIRFKTGYYSPYERNRIIFGAPGTGKSYLLNQDVKKLIGQDHDADYERVTFHPDYSYANFMGTYKPVPVVEDGKTVITYEYVPGPFMRVYVNAIKNSRTDNIRPFLLVIEEINRANVAAVFGDIFQLLDRNDDNVSEYPIEATEDVKRYLTKELGMEARDCSRICIPDNMFIWATMNSADQGVFPVDTAFKRRWDFTYLGIDDSDQDIRGKYVILGGERPHRVEWNNLRKAINHFLTNEKINEDKLLGPYFIARRITVPAEGNEIDRDNFVRVFKNKIIMYLFEDAAKQKRSKLFEGCGSHGIRYSEICKEFDNKGIGIFNQAIQNEAKAEFLESDVANIEE